MVHTRSFTDQFLFDLRSRLINALTAMVSITTAAIEDACVSAAGERGPSARVACGHESVAEVHLVEREEVAVSVVPYARVEVAGE